MRIRRRCPTDAADEHSDGNPGRPEFTGAAQVVFGAPTTVTDEDASLDDDLKASGFPVTLASGDSTVTYTTNVSCGEDRTITNTASLTETDSNTNHTDQAAVAVDCNGLSVSKNASTTYAQSYNWTVQKLVSTDATCTTGFVDASVNLELFNGDTQTVCWKIVADRGEAQETGFAVSGTITVTNNASIAASNVSVSDGMEPGSISGIVDCDGVAGAPLVTTVNIPANSFVTCAYSSPLPNKTPRTNTATATLAGQNYTGAAQVVFGAPTTVTDEARRWMMI